MSLFQTIRFLAYDEKPIKLDHAIALGYFASNDPQKESAAKNTIFLALSLGKLPAFGIKTDNIDKNGQLTPEEDARTSNIANAETPEEIPACFWSLRCIDWGAGRCWQTSVREDLIDEPLPKVTKAPPPIPLRGSAAATSQKIEMLKENLPESLANETSMPPWLDYEKAASAPPRKSKSKNKGKATSATLLPREKILRQTVYSLGGYIGITLKTADVFKVLEAHNADKSPLTHSGGAGRSSAMHLYRKELLERFGRKASKPSLRAEAAAILDAVKKQYPDINHSKCGAIENGLRDDYNKIKPEILAWSEE